jgi:hypothetical protein
MPRLPANATARRNPAPYCRFVLPIGLCADLLSSVRQEFFIMMRTVTLATASLLALAAATGIAQAQDRNFGYQPGDWQFTLSGTGSNDRHFDSGSFGASVGLSYFLTSGLEAGVRQDMFFADTGRDDTWNATTRAGLWYNFDLGRLKPFVGASVGYVYGDNVNDSFMIGPEVGLKYFVNSTTFVYAQTAYQYFIESDDDVGDRFDDGSFNHTVGIGFRF